MLLVYLIVYYVLVAGALVTLWRADLIQHLHRGWTYGSIVFAVALGALLWLSFRK